jgi:hypothetical protein
MCIADGADAGNGQGDLVICRDAANARTDLWQVLVRGTAISRRLLRAKPPQPGHSGTDAIAE